MSNSLGRNSDNFNMLVDEIKTHEGLELKLYKCSADKWTAGYGRNMEDNGLREIEAVFMLMNDIEATINECKSFSWFDSLTPTRQRVIANIVFNIGMPSFMHFEMTIKAIKRGDWVAAGDELVDSKWFREVKTRGIMLVELWRAG